MNPTEAPEGPYWHTMTVIGIFSILDFQVWPPPSLPWSFFLVQRTKKLKNAHIPKSLLAPKGLFSKTLQSSLSLSQIFGDAFFWSDGATLPADGGPIVTNRHAISDPIGTEFAADDLVGLSGLFK